MTMFWIALITGVINAVFILDLLVTLATGSSLAMLLTRSTDNTVASAVISAIPTDPTTFWIVSGFVIAFVCSIEVLLIYLAFYADPKVSGVRI